MVDFHRFHGMAMAQQTRPQTKAAQAVSGSNTKYRNACLAIREQQVGHMHCKRLVHRIYNDSATG